MQLAVKEMDMGSESAPEKPWDQQPEESKLWVVPHVVLLREGLCVEDKALLARKFWSAIGLGKEPPVAWEEAMGSGL
jgi:hypothetical protein